MELVGGAEGRCGRWRLSSRFSLGSEGAQAEEIKSISGKSKEVCLSRILGVNDGEKDETEERYSVATSYQASHKCSKLKFFFKKEIKICLHAETLVCLTIYSLSP